MNPTETYRILQRLGDSKRRKFNDVFLVEHKQTGEKAVLKSLAKTNDNGHLQELLRRESTFHFDLPGLPRTLDFYESENELLLFRSYEEGIPLRQFLQNVKQKQKPAVLLSILRALEPLLTELRNRQIVHLDLKPGNLIIAGTPENPTVSLIDFGMAIRTDEPVNRTTLFPLGYAAPELLLNRLELVDQRTDLFALGIVLWQSFTERIPLLHANPSITTNLQLTHPLPEDPAIPKAFYPILLKMSAKFVFPKPPNQLPETEVDRCLKAAMDSRYASLGEVLCDWEAALEKPTGFFSKLFK